MKCGHPLAARIVRVIAGRLVTRCWACEVEAELREKAA